MPGWFSPEEQRDWLPLDQVPRWGEVDPVWSHTPLDASSFSPVFISLLLGIAGTTLLALLPPPCHCFSQNPSLPAPSASQLHNSKWWFVPFMSGFLNTTRAKHTQRWDFPALLLWFAGKNSSCSSWAVLREAPCHPLCHSPWSSLVPVPGTAAGGMLASAESKNNVIGKISMITRQENIPMCFLQKVHSFFSTMHGL